MKTDKEILQQFGEQLLKDVKAVIPVATGRTAGRVTLETSESSIEIEGDAHIGALIDGRAPTGSGAKTTGKALQESILEWMKAKGIHAKVNLALRQAQDQSKLDLALSWAISKSIHKKGTLLYREGGGNNIFETIISPSRIDALVDSLVQPRMTMIESQVIKGLTTK